MEAALQPGLAIDECVARLKRFHYVWKRLHGIWTARITGEPIMNSKRRSATMHTYGRAHGGLRERVGEMREPPLGLEDVPHPGLAYVGDEILPRRRRRYSSVFTKRSCQP